MVLPKLPIQSIRYIAICLVAILGFGLLAIFPSHQAIRATERKIEKLQQEIEEQEVLKSLFQNLLKQAQSKAPSEMPFPKKEKLSREETDGIFVYFQELAEKNDFKVESIVPDVVSLTDGSGHLMLNTTMKGEFLNFRRLLLEIGELPYIEQIETIQIRTVGQLKEFRLKIWIAQG